MCGEKFGILRVQVAGRGSPPHVRGKEENTENKQQGHRITPACAGKSFNIAFVCIAFKDHPRMCGEKETCLLVAAYRLGSPPHVRGKD